MRTLTIKALLLVPMAALVAFSATGAQEQVSREPLPRAERSGEAAGRDENLSRKVTTEFRNDPLFEGMTLTIDLYKGLAIVHGGAANQQMVALVTRRLQNNPGVDVVYNYMSSPDMPLSQPESIAVTYDHFDRMAKVGNKSNAFAIAGDVKDRLTADARLSGLDFDVDSYLGLIVLHGNGASAAQATRAKEIAAHTPGVEAVLSYVTIDAPLGPVVVTREAPIVSREVIVEPVPVRTEIHGDCCR
jgi:osmotically-inducible protein OsmY